MVPVLKEFTISHLCIVLPRWSVTFEENTTRLVMILERVLMTWNLFYGFPELQPSD
jgi:hypothetical protein